MILYPRSKKARLFPTLRAYFGKKSAARRKMPRGRRRFFTVTGGQNAIFIKKGNPFVPIAEIVIPARFSASIHAGIATP